MPLIIVADEHYVLRMGIKVIIGEICPAAVVREANTFYDVLELLAGLECDLLMLDTDLPGGNGPRMIGEICAASPNTPVLVFSRQEEESHALGYLKAGSKGYLQKTAMPETIDKAIRTVLEGNTFVSDKVQARLIGNIPKSGTRKHDKGLSPREFEVMQLMVNGVGNRDIKSALNIQSSTLSTFKSKIFGKMAVTNLIDLVKKVNSLKVNG